jgi:hypothetical protein
MRGRIEPAPIRVFTHSLFLGMPFSQQSPGIADERAQRSHRYDMMWHRRFWLDAAREFVDLAREDSESDRSAKA